MTRLGVALSILIGLVVSGCVTNPSLSSYKPKGPEESLIVGTLQRIPAGIKARSVEIIMPVYDDDVYVGNFHKYLGVAGRGAVTTLRGKQDVALVYRQILRNVQNVSLDVRDFRLSVTGDRAVAEALLEMSFKLEGGRRDTMEELVRNEVVWRMRRTPAGWKIVEEIFQ